MSDILRVFHRGCGGQVKRFYKTVTITKHDLEIHHTFEEISEGKYAKIFHVGEGGESKDYPIDDDEFESWYECDSCKKRIEVEDDPPYKNILIANTFKK